MADVGITGGGGLVRDDKGSWQGGFSIRMQCTSVEVIETWAFLYGLKMAWEMGIGKLIVEINSLEVYSWVEGINVIKNSLSNVIQEC